MNKTGFLLIIFFVFLVTGYGQNTKELILSESNNNSSLLYSYPDRNIKPLFNRNPDFNLTIGSGISTYPGGSVSLNSYIAPSMSYYVNTNLKIDIGGVFSNTNSPTPSIFPSEQSNNNFNRPSYYSIYAHGMYRIGERLMITGSVIQEKSDVPGPKPVYNYLGNNSTNLMERSFKSFSMGFNYKISDYLNIGAEVRVSDGFNPYYSPYRRHRNPFSSSFSNYPSTIWW